MYMYTCRMGALLLISRNPRMESGTKRNQHGFRRCADLKGTVYQEMLTRNKTTQFNLMNMSIFFFPA